MTGEIESSARTDLGRVRPTNEDAFHVDDRLGLYVVSDGMGGHAGGERASALTVETIRTAIEGELGRDREQQRSIVETVRDAIESASRAVFEEARSNPKNRGMGCTATVLLLDGRRAVLGHVGDSRLYLARAGAMHQLTSDHRVTAELISLGVLTEEAAKVHPYRNMLSRTVGTQANVVVETLHLDLQPGDAFVLATDGLNEAVDADAAETSRQVRTESLDEVAVQLIDKANALGGRDNATVVIVRPAFDPDARPAMGPGPAALARFPMFEGLSLAGRARVLRAGTILSVEAGEVLIGEGAQYDALYCVLEGALRWESDGADVDDVDVADGDCTGELAIARPRPAPGRLVATKDSLVFVLTAASLWRLARRRTQLGVGIYRRLAGLLAI